MTLLEEAHDELDAPGHPKEENIEEAAVATMLPIPEAFHNAAIPPGEVWFASKGSVVGAILGAIPVVDHEPFKDFGEAVEETTTAVEDFGKASSGVIPRPAGSIVPPSVGKCFEPDF